ncbi:MerR family transcriptional regulator [Mumia sp. zg.B53]|uniref:transcriptional regulator FtsR n=1 Tax=unclassified Mumia TaxID=2621872 RepID=UPI001C6DED67|nr:MULTISPECIES: MerR family transcriptional regulator [unclassified Mumia]MBW9205006.1 MerR family transcriptional regulator [Mumia sp. zg.B17]MBW9213600.1 MerR family transcriptional regulator [Mumia sp. zg.B53]MDD9347496.1 MerR family transcriptional regulator [Mumia sp.]
MTQAAPNAARLSIGEVLDELRTDFPDISISKIRYLETEGLVEPERTPSGYRKFSRADVERLHLVLRVQRDTYWPLKVIRQKLDDLDRGILSSDDEGTLQVPRVIMSSDGLPGPDTFASSPKDIRFRRSELLQASEIDEDLLDEAEQYGLVAPSSGHFTEADVVIAKTLGELAAFGLEPRHLRSIRTAADREVSMLEQIVEPLRRRRDPESAARADETARNIASLSVLLHTMLVKNGLRHRG